MFRISLIVLLVLAGNQSIIAQETGEEDLGAWAMYFGTNRVSDDLSVHTEVQYRMYETASNFNQLLLRTGLNYHISDRTMVTLGYGHIVTDPTFEEPLGEENTVEHRIYQQFVFDDALGKFAFNHRYRLEQRFIDTPGSGSVTRHRARYFLRITYPLSNSWFLTAYDEIFINLQEPIFDQNRLFGALGYRLNKAVSLQFGYLKNHFRDRDFDRLQLAVFWNTDLRKKDEK